MDSAPPLRSSDCSDARGIVFRQRHDDARQLHGVEKDAAKEEFLRRVVQAADEMSLMGVTLDWCVVFAQSALATAIESRHGDTLASISQLLHPVTTAPAIPMKHEHGGPW